MTDYQRIGLPVIQWPPELRVAAKQLAPCYRQATGRLLAYCRDTNLPINENSVRQYISWRTYRVAAATLKSETVALRYALLALLPDHDWEWLRAAAVRRRAHRTKRAARASLLSVPVEEWPPQARAILAPTVSRTYTGPGRYQAIVARRPASIDDNTRASIRTAYGQYLAHRRATGLDDSINAEGIATFVGVLSERKLRPRSIATYISSLAILARTMAPQNEWTWLLDALHDLNAWAREAPKRKHGRPLPHPLELWNVGMGLIAQARRQEPGRLAAAELFRDGVLLQLLTALPMRLTNATRLKIGHEVVMDDGVRPVRIALDCEQTKNGDRQDWTLWPELQAVLAEYIAIWRPTLARGYRGDDLWLAGRGSAPGPMSPTGIYRIICCRTHAAFGFAVNPHYIRDIVASAMIEALPQQPDYVSDLLHHRSPRARQEYTEQASALTACRAMRAAVTACRETTRKRVLGLSGFPSR